MPNEFLEQLRSLPGGVEISPLLLVALAIALIFAIVIIIVNLKLVLDIAPYAYPNAKVRSMQSMLIRKKKFEEIIELENIMNIASALEETDYGKPLSENIGEKADILKVEASLNQDLIETFLKISQFLPGNAKKVFKVYMKKFEVGNIKTVLRGIHAKISKEEIKKSIAPAYTEELKDIIESSRIEEAVSRLEDTEYGKVLSQALSEYEKTSSLLPLETALDRYIYGQIGSAITTYRSPNVETLKKLIGTEIDIQNIKLIFRAAIEEAKEDVSKYIIPYGYELTGERLKELSGIKDMERIVSDLDGTSYHDALVKAFGEYKEGESARIFEKALDKHYVSLGSTIALRQPFGLGPVIGYAVAKVSEVRSLITILKLKVEGFAPEDIRRAIT